MTRVEFFVNVPDKLVQVASLCGKALSKGRQLTVFAENERICKDLQHILWQHEASSFLPSALSREPLSKVTPIVLAIDGLNLIQDDVLINLQSDCPPFFSRFRYLIEIVGQDEADKAQARMRYKFYRDRGYQIKSTDLAAAPQ
ncbi:MAG: DNA polymerase III subunit chi [Betaproteobacteria bacterium HGW-Betaproteobacteria-22]|nr:MAG: DNA polymerase III subunit chi [Betaproteobacteria bacterium HGW-Betaproteobacteria-22]